MLQKREQREIKTKINYYVGVQCRYIFTKRKSQQIRWFAF